MHVREATPDDNAELQELQAQCPMGTTLIVSTVNTPDFFARAKAYESCEVFVACELRSIGQIFCVCERDHVLLSSMKGFIRIDTAMHLYIEPLQQNILMGDNPVFIDGIDL